MNSKEIWTRWEPELDLAGNYYIQYIEDAADSFRIVLSKKGSEQLVEIIFDELINTYRKGDVDFKLALIKNLSQNYTQEFYDNWTFFEVKNSSYLNLLSVDSVNTAISQKHFVIIGVDSVLDIITNLEPEIHFVEMQAEVDEAAPVSKIGLLADGSITNLRKYSKDGRAVLETFQHNQSTKIRYGNVQK